MRSLRAPDMRLGARTVLAAGLIVAAAGAAFAQSDTTAVAARPPQLYLAWGAPWGTPGARAQQNAPCGAESASDTLYLSFDPGRNSDTFFGIMGELYFRSASADSLGPLWSFEDRPETDNNLDLQFPSHRDSSWGAPSPWRGIGFGAKKYDRTARSGRLQVVYAVPEQVAGPIVGGRRYLFGRLIVPRGVPGMTTCAQPVCVEWSTAGLTFEVDSGEIDASRQGGSRFVTWNSKDGRACAEYTGILTPSGWKPKRSTP